MSQPEERVDGPGRADVDPLLEFNAELEAAEAAEVPEIPADPAPVALAPPPDDVGALKQRLDSAERSLDRAFTDIGVLKSDFATLVTTIDDIRKRQSRKPEPDSVPGPVLVPPPSPALTRRTSGATIAAVAILVAVLGAAVWRVSSLVTGEAEEVVSGEPGAVSAAPQTPLPKTELVSSEVGVASSTPESQLPANNTIVPVAATIEPPPAEPRVRAVPERQAPAMGYFGGLSIDSYPPGEVFIDRKPAGRTPVRVDKLRAGSHLVWIERDGYRRWTRVVAVTANDMSRVTAQLDPLSQ